MAYGDKNDQQQGSKDEHGQKCPTDQDAVRQRHQLGTPQGQKPGQPIPKAP